MGVIKRQGIKQSIVTYLSTAIGAVNVLFISTFILTAEELGFYNFFISTGMLVMPFALIGTNSIVIRFYPEFKNKSNGDNGFFRLILSLSLIGLGITSTLIYFFQDLFSSFYADKMAGFEGLFLLFIPLIIFKGLSVIFTAHINNYQRIVVPAILNNLLLKITFPLFCILYYFDLLSYEGLLLGMMSVFALIPLALIAYLYHLNGIKLQPINWSFLDAVRKKRVFSFMQFGVLVGLSGNIAFLIDIFMVGSLINVGQVAVYSIAFFIADVIDIPKKAIASISAPIIAKAWNENNKEEIKKIYKKSSINLFLYASLLLALIWASIFDLFAIIPKGEVYSQGAMVVLILGCTKVIDAVTSVNDQVLSLSKYYKVSFYSILTLSVVNILNNMWLIPMHQINGAALSTLISVLLFNLIKLIFIQYKMGFHPFGKNHIKVLLLAFSCYFIGYSLPLDFHPIWNIVLRSILIMSIFLSISIYFKLSTDVNEALGQVLRKIKDYRSPKT